jgi:hypothetical protein
MWYEAIVPVYFVKGNDRLLITKRVRYGLSAQADIRDVKSQSQLSIAIGISHSHS